MRHLVLLLSTLTIFFAQMANAQYWTIYVGTGYGVDNSIAPPTIGGAKGAEMRGPMWSLGCARSFGDSSVHMRLGLEWEHQVWDEPFHYSGYYTGGGFFEEREGQVSANIDLLRAAPLVVMPVGRTFNFLVGLDLGLMLSARIAETSHHRFAWSNSFQTYPYGEWSAIDSTYHGTSVLNIYQWSLRLGGEVTLERKWFTSAGISVGTSAYRPSTGSVESPTPIFLRAAIGRRW